MTRQDIDAEVKRQSERLLSQERTPTAVKVGRIQNQVLAQAGVTDTLTITMRATAFQADGAPASPAQPTPLVLALRRVDQAGCLRVVDERGLTAYEKAPSAH
jgi:hypothetical protein